MLGLVDFCVLIKENQIKQINKFDQKIFFFSRIIVAYV